ncbi:MAG: polyprenyl synthetase family protein [Myxococcota bacterium]
MSTELQIPEARRAPFSTNAYTPPGPVSRTAIGTESRVDEAFEQAFRRAVAEEGLLGSALDHHFCSLGKRHRARLALTSSTALGLSMPVSVSFAVACELLHNASLVHDDLQDRDRERHGRPTVWAAFGDDVAINVGDYLLTRAFEVAAGAPISPEHALDVVGAFTNATTAVIRGQIADNDYARAPKVDLAYFESVARGKTGPLLALPVQAAVSASGLAPRYREIVARSFETLAVAFQTANDLADVIGGDARAAGSDLRSGRPNVVVGLHTTLVDSTFLARAEAARTLRITHPEEVPSLIAEVTASPAIEAAFDLADRALEAAREHAGALPVPLRPIFDETVEQVVSPLRALRKRFHRDRDVRPIALNEHRNGTDIPVHA